MEVLTIDENEEFLRKISNPVDFNDGELRNDIENLIDFTNNRSTVWAMASVQLGILKRIVYIKSTDAKGPGDKDSSAILLINPIVISKKGKTTFWEACASCHPNIGLVERPYSIIVRYQDINGNYNEKAFDGFEATVVSHELDHLDGILHMDRAIELKQLDSDGRAKLRVEQPYKVISTDCKFEYKDIRKRSI